MKKELDLNNIIDELSWIRANLESLAAAIPSLKEAPSVIVNSINGVTSHLERIEDEIESGINQ